MRSTISFPATSGATQLPLPPGTSHLTSGRQQVVLSRHQLSKGVAQFIQLPRTPLHSPAF
jgi:hypothetical protein